MDDLDDLPESEEDLFTAIIGVAHVLGFAVGAWKLWRYLTKKADPAAEVEATADQLQPKKRVLTSYLLWLVAGTFGAHHYYLGRIVHGLLATWSFNLMGMGYVLDGLMMPWYVHWFNSRHTAPNARYDSSRRALLCRLPAIVLAAFGVVASVGLYLPRALHTMGIVDIDRLAAQTESNPYEVLGLSWTASLADAKAAYRRQSLQWHPDRNLGCGKRCEDKMSEVTKAFELIKKRRAPPPPDRTWEAWLQGLGSDWVHVLEALASQDQGSSGPAAAAGASTARKGARAGGAAGARPDL